MICSSLNRFRIMFILLERTQPYYVRVSREQARVHPTSEKFQGLRSGHLWLLPVNVLASHAAALTKRWSHQTRTDNAILKDIATKMVTPTAKQEAAAA